ncbi:MAG TPA: group II intron maturase-specific domain-containing protein, partial [Thermoanaerobaculia bacterium]|nr:group II intron maturase-specific domain-containing protein [Thermoanaerobaculia bacterium]
TAGNRLSRAIRKVKEWCRKNRHLDIAEQCKALASKLRGHYQYFGLTGACSASSQRSCQAHSCNSKLRSSAKPKCASFCIQATGL